MHRLSIKSRLTIWYILLMAIVSAIVLTAVSSFGYDMIERDAKERLTKSVDDMARMISGSFAPNPPPDNDNMQRRKFYMHGVHMLVMNENMEIVEGQVPFSITDSMDFSDGSVRKKSYDGNQYLVYDKKVIDRNGEVKLLKGIVSVNEESYAVNSVLKNNMILTVVLILLAAIGGYFITGKALKPVDKMSKTAKSIIDSKDLSRRINAGEGKDEIVELANTFDNMLDEIEISFEREKQFTSDASHELRTPIAVIMSECEYMIDCADTVEELKESAASVKEEAEKMSRLVSELLMIARMDKNTIKPDFEETDVSELADYVASEQQMINSKDITLKKNIKPGIIAKIDRFLIARVMINLISNAYKYNKENGSIEISLNEDEEQVVFSVSDSGIGISEENQPKIWERFFQVDPSRTANENGSMGLGLAMVQWIAKCHGGSIRVESVLGEGSTFIFTFPKNK